MTGVGVGFPVGVGDGEAVGVGLGLTVGDSDGEGEGLGVGVDPTGVGVGDNSKTVKNVEHAALVPGAGVGAPTKFTWAVKLSNVPDTFPVDPELP